MTRKILSLVGVFILLLSALAFTSENAHASTSIANQCPLAIPGPQPGSPPSWRVEGQPYIHISSSYVATIDPSMAQNDCISPSDRTSIGGAVEWYNNQTLALREYTGPSGSSSARASHGRSVVPNGAGDFQSYTILQWWGYQTFLNEHDTVQLDLDLKVGAGGVVLLAAICAATIAGTAPCVTIGGIIVAALGLEVALLEAIDHSCGNIGIQADATVTNSAAWFYQIC